MSVAAVAKGADRPPIYEYVALLVAAMVGATLAVALVIAVHQADEMADGGRRAIVQDAVRTADTLGRDAAAIRLLLSSLADLPSLQAGDLAAFTRQLDQISEREGLRLRAWDRERRVPTAAGLPPRWADPGDAATRGHDILVADGTVTSERIYDADRRQWAVNIALFAGRARRGHAVRRVLPAPAGQAHRAHGGADAPEGRGPRRRRPPRRDDRGQRRGRRASGRTRRGGPGAHRVRPRPEGSLPCRRSRGHPGDRARNDLDRPGVGARRRSAHPVLAGGPAASVRRPVPAHGRDRYGLVREPAPGAPGPRHQRIPPAASTPATRRSGTRPNGACSPFGPRRTAASRSRG